MTIITNQLYSMEVNKNLHVIVASVILIIVVLVIASIPHIHKFVRDGFFYNSIATFF